MQLSNRRQFLFLAIFPVVLQYRELIFRFCICIIYSYIKKQCNYVHFPLSYKFNIWQVNYIQYQGQLYSNLNLAGQLYIATTLSASCSA